MSIQGDAVLWRGVLAAFRALAGAVVVFLRVLFAVVLAADDLLFALPFGLVHHPPVMKKVCTSLQRPHWKRVTMRVFDEEDKGDRICITKGTHVGKKGSIHTGANKCPQKIWVILEDEDDDF